jgi:hypothetical protein
MCNFEKRALAVIKLQLMTHWVETVTFVFNAGIGNKRLQTVSLAASVDAEDFYFTPTGVKSQPDQPAKKKAKVVKF